MTAALALLALLIEAMAGYPNWLARAIGHPVMWMGRLIGLLDRALNRETASGGQRQTAGVVAILVLLIVVGVLSVLIERGLLLLPFGIVAVAIVASTLLAQRSL